MAPQGGAPDPAGSRAALDKKVRKINWPRWVGPGASFALPTDMKRLPIAAVLLLSVAACEPGKIDGPAVELVGERTTYG